MRRWTTPLFVLILCLAFTLTAQAAPRVVLDGKDLTFDVPPPVSEQGRTLVPLRGTLEALGAFVQWDDATQTVTATRADTQVRLTLGSMIAYKNGQPVLLDVPAKTVRGRTMVPLRFVSESFGAWVGWDSTNQTVVISSTGQPVYIAPAPAKTEVTQPTTLQQQSQSVTTTTPSQQQVQTQGNTVYITKTGAKYHRNGCQYLARSKIPIDLSNAVASGYTPCSVCNPGQISSSTSSPILTMPSSTPQIQKQDVTVYVTRTGSKYHRGGCRYLSKSQIPMSLSNAKASGYTACSVCGPPR
ncbi:copper amine oxidase domain protein [Candidatus Desulforudis audaxviator MP104C]|uniref:Copper amine oxidase domain protein n=2 Tax=Candidatus Desulforudis TaxID=471826 RepID=B1I2F3_DESAP|nr:copper amine oxidase domain protein [Candidatus Desulforudis audaxviator MP104C]